LAKSVQQLINKGVVTSGSFTGSIGMTHDEANTFIDYVVDESWLKGNVRLERMSAATKKIDKLDIGGRVLVPATAAQDPGNTVGIETSQIELVAREMIAIAEIGDDSLEDNIEGDAFVDHLMRMVAAKIGNELEEAYLMGKALLPGQMNTATHINQLFEGWYQRSLAGAHIFDCSTSDTRFIDRPKLSKALKLLPTKYRRNKANMRYLMADDLSQDYNDYLADSRGTPLGDNFVMGTAQMSYSNIRLQSMSLLPTEMPVAKTGGVSTKMTSDVPAKSMSFQVVSVTGITAGQELVLGLNTPYEEKVMVSAVDADTKTVTIRSLLAFKHYAGSDIQECTSDGTFAMLTDYRNLICGIHRDIRFETERHPRKRSTSFVFTLRADVQMENPEAVVLLTNLQVK